MLDFTLMMIVFICCLSVLVNGMFLMLAIKKSEESIVVYRNILSLVKHVKTKARSRR